MTTFPIRNRNRAALLRRTLRSNALFSLLTGLTALVAARPLAGALGVPSAGLLMVLGAALLLFGAQLAILAFRPSPGVLQATATAVLDALWVLGSVVVLATGLGELTPVGRWTVLAVGDVVLVFTVLEIIGLARLTKMPTPTKMPAKTPG